MKIPGQLPTDGVPRPAVGGLPLHSLVSYLSNQESNSHPPPCPDDLQGLGLRLMTPKPYTLHPKPDS